MKKNESNLKKIRLAMDYSQTELSENSGVNKRMIQYYEQGLKNINNAQAITLYELSKSLNCKIEDLLELKEKEEEKEEKEEE